jgi:hypothetical protein
MSIQKQENIERELAAAQWSILRLNLLGAAGVFLGGTFMCNSWPLLGLLIIGLTVAFYFSARPRLMEVLEYRRNWIAFAQMTEESIFVFSRYPGDPLVEAKRKEALTWLERVGNTNVKVVSAIYGHTRFFVDWVDETTGKIDGRSYEQDPADFRCDFERFEELCADFKNRIDRALIESQFERSPAFVAEHMMNQI